MLSGNCLFVLDNHFSPLDSAIFSPDNQFALTIGQDEQIYVYNVVYGHLIVIITQDDIIASAIFSEEGTQILSVLGNGNVTLCNFLGNCSTWFENNVSEMLAVTYSKLGSGVLVSSVEGNYVKIYDVLNDQTILWDFEHDSELSMVYFSNGGMRLVTVC